MALPEIDPDPMPSEDDLKPYLKGLPDEIARDLAEMGWRVDTRERDPNAFLVPFSTDAFPRAGFSAL